MYVGGSVFLIALGAVIRFAVADNVVEGVDLDIAGWILMAVGFLGLIVSLVQLAFLRRDERREVVADR
jgi:hypothetical protein